MQVLLQIPDGFVPLIPDVFGVVRLPGKSLAAKQFRMDSNDKDILVIRTVEDTDAASFRKTASSAPEKIVFKFLGARLLETVNLATLRIDPGHDVPDRAILAGTVHPLKDKQ